MNATYRPLLDVIVTDPYATYRPLLDLIGYTEGTDKGRGYNETLAYGKFTGGPVELVSMTLDEIDKLQTGMLNHPKNKLHSSAVGRYQIVRTTLRSIKKALKLTGKERFDEKMQDRLACFLLGRRGIDRYIGGELSESSMINQLAREWASLPTVQDRGHYDGQKAFVRSARVREVLREVKELAATKVPPKNEAEVGVWRTWIRRLLKLVGLR